MSDVTIYGSSDDLIEIDGDVRGCDEYNGERASFVLVGGEAQLHVRVEYTKGGVWEIAVAPVDEGVPMLPVEICAAERGYSAQAIVKGVSSVIREADSDA